MNLIKNKTYKTKIGCFSYKSGTRLKLFHEDLEKNPGFIPAGSIVEYGGKNKDNIHIFYIGDKRLRYITVLDELLKDNIDDTR